MKSVNFKKSIALSDYFRIVNPQYTYLKLVPNYSVKNTQTDLIAKTIANMYKPILKCIKGDRERVVRALGKDFLLSTRYSLHTYSKVMYYIYISKEETAFYFVVPTEYARLLRESILNVWSTITIKEVLSLPTFKPTCTKFQMAYSHEDALSINADKRSNELLSHTLNIIDVLSEKDKIAIVYNFMPITQFGWQNEYKTTIEKVKNGIPATKNKLNPKYLLQMVLKGGDIVFKDIEALFKEEKKKNEFTLEIGKKSIDKLTHTFDVLHTDDKISSFTKKKEKSMILDTQILILSDAQDKKDELMNAKMMTYAFEEISKDEDNQLVAKNLGQKPLELMHYKWSKVDSSKMSTLETQNFIALAGRELLTKYKNIEHTDILECPVPKDLQSGCVSLGYNRYRGQPIEAFLLDGDIDLRCLAHFVIGPNRSGKTTLFSNWIKNMLDNNECVILLDYCENCKSTRELVPLFKSKVLRIQCDNMKQPQSMGYNEIPKETDPFQQYANAKLQCTSLVALVNSINVSDKRLAPRMEKYLEAAAVIVFIQEGRFIDVMNVLDNAIERHRFLNSIPIAHLERLEKYILYLHELDESDDKGNYVSTKYSLVSGIIDRMNKLTANPYMENMLSAPSDFTINLVEEIQKSQLITIEMPDMLFLTDQEKDIYVTYWLTKIHLALRVREYQLPSPNRRRERVKVNLFIDEIYHVEQAQKFLSTIFARIAKLDCKLILSAHYITQPKYIYNELTSANPSYTIVQGCTQTIFDELKKELAPFTYDDYMALKKYEAIHRIKDNDSFSTFVTKLPPPIKSS